MEEKSLTRRRHRLLGLVGFVLKRQRHHPGLTLLSLIGVILAVGLVTSASFFSSAVDRVTLLEELAEFSRVTGRPPFSTRVYIRPTSTSPMSLQALEQAAPNIGETLATEIGLPLKHVRVEASSGGMMLQPRAGSGTYGEGESYLESVNLIYKEESEAHIEITGEPLDHDQTSIGALDVWMHADLAGEMGVQVSDAFDIGVTLAARPTPIRVRGLWQVQDPKDPFWFGDPGSGIKTMLLIRRQDYASYVEPLIPSQIAVGNWYVILDERTVAPENARQYREGFDRSLAVVNKYMPGARLDTPPLGPLEQFVNRETTLTILLLGFNVPALGFLLYFLLLTSTIVSRWQRHETAVLVSRGMGVRGILGVTLIEELVLFVVGCPLGIGLGMLLARMMGYTDSFLSFISRSPLPVRLQTINLPLLLGVLAVSLLTRLWAAAGPARRSVVEIEREQTRPQRSPFWHRFYLDIILILPTIYAYHQLSERGSLALLVQDRPEDLYRDPLLILVPALFVLTIALLSMRLFPLVMRGVDLLASVMPWVMPHLALRQLGRQSQGYINPLLLIIVSLALGVYTMSMAASLDQWLTDRMYYRVGADLAFQPNLDSEDTEAIDPQAGSLGGEWIPPPEEFSAMPGVLAATRVGDFIASIDIAGADRLDCRFLAIDRAAALHTDFPSVAWFRDDFADESLGGLMNRLAQSPEAILVSNWFLRENNLQVGDLVSIRIVLDRGWEVTSAFVVAGTYDYFPTVYEEERITIIGNLGHLEFLNGVTVPHHMWLKTQDDVDGDALMASTARLVGVGAVSRQNTRALIEEERAKVERVGIFGTLTVGFLASVAMAVTELMIYSYASLQRRLYRFTILRAVGLTRMQIVTQVVLEYAFLTIYGALVGAFVGIWAANLFVPFFRVTGESGIPLPPLLPIIALQGVSWLVGIFVCTMVLLKVFSVTRTLSRRRFGMLRALIWH